MAYDLDGSDDFIFWNNRFNSKGNSVSVSFWINPDTVTQNRNIFWFQNSGATALDVVCFLSGSTLSGSLEYRRTTNATNKVRRSATGVVSVSTWNHVLITDTSSLTASDAHIYVNGAEVGSYDLTSNGSGTENEGNGAEVVGGSTGAGTPWDGDVAEVAVWNDVLTAADAAQLGKGYSANLVKPNTLRLYAPLIRRVDCTRVKDGSSGGAPPVSVHPRIINASRIWIAPPPDSATTLLPPTIASGATVNAPTVTVGDVTLTGAHLASGAVISEPSVAHQVELPTITSTAVTYEPSLAVGAVTLEPPTIAAGSTVTAPSTTYVVALPTIAAGSATYEPTVAADPLLELPFITSGSTVFRPTVSDGTAASVTGGDLSSMGVIHQIGDRPIMDSSMGSF
jgi:hypothetical protein